MFIRSITSIVTLLTRVHDSLNLYIFQLYVWRAFYHIKM